MDIDARRVLTSSAPVRPERDYVLYWMVSARRCRHSAALDHAVRAAVELRRPLLVFEPLRVDHRWASVRQHRLVVEGMQDQAAGFGAAGVQYLPYVEPSPGAGAGLLEALAERACVVVTDHFPAYFLARMVRAVAGRLDVRLEAIDGNSLFPLASHVREVTVARSHRLDVHRRVAASGLPPAPRADPLQDYALGEASLPPGVATRWPAADLEALLRGGLASLPIDQAVPAIALRGGARAAEAQLDGFLSERFPRYGVARTSVQDPVSSGISPYLHFGHLGVHEVVERAMAAAGWRADGIDPARAGRREGFWGAGPSLDAFLDEVWIWRELGFAYCHRHPNDHADFTSLPPWALKTLEDHRGDERTVLYELEDLEQGRTHDPLWNAAQHQLRAEGRIHPYLRMLWGKHVISWSRSPEEALETLFALNDRWAMDGRDPNTVNGIMWCFGRFDRAWGPERPVVGKLRYMSSASTARKMRVEAYVARWARWHTESGPIPEVPR